jgi:hypothetical protein
MIKGQGLKLNVAWVDDDHVLETVKQKLRFEGEIFENICTAERLEDWPFEPISAQGYLVNWASQKAFEMAQI